MELRTVTIDSDTEIFVQDNYHNAQQNRKTYAAWLNVNGVNVGMIRYLVGGNEVAVLGDIEIRSEFRGNKLSTKFIHLLETHVVGETLHTTGHYTPEGYRSLARVLPLTPYAISRREEPKAYFRSMNFVHNWELLQLEN